MTIASPRSIAIVPMIAISPTTSGSSAATMLPKTQISTTTVIGMAIDLGHGQVGLGLVVDLLVGVADAAAEHGHAVVGSGERLGQVGRALGCLAVVTGDPRDHESRPAVATAQGGGLGLRRRPVGLDLARVRRCLDGLHHRETLGARRLVVDPGGRGDLDDQVGVAGLEVVLQEVLRARGGGARVLEAAGGQVVRRRAPEHAREHEQEAGHRKDAARSGDAEFGQTSEHGSSRCGRRSN